MALAVLALVAVVAELETLFAVEMVASFVSAMAAFAAMSALAMPVTVAESTIWCSAAGVTSSPLMNVFPLVTVAIIS